MHTVSDTQQYSRLRWQCRRGMRELDILLQDFLDMKYRQLTAKEQGMFQQLLTYSDQVLFEYLMGNMTPMDGDIANVVEQIRNTAKDRP